VAASQAIWSAIPASTTVPSDQLRMGRVTDQMDQIAVIPAGMPVTGMVSTGAYQFHEGIHAPLRPGSLIHRCGQDVSRWRLIHSLARDVSRWRLVHSPAGDVER
jgi:hypothetical protein